jgi:hypothetical protein
VSSYLTIPEITESEPLHSVQMEHDNKSFVAVLATDSVAVRLNLAAQNGEQIALVVLTTDNAIIALDNVYVVSVAFTQREQSPVAEVTFQAEAVRFV